MATPILSAPIKIVPWPKTFEEFCKVLGEPKKRKPKKRKKASDMDSRETASR